jgi:hypothetical protein
MVKVFAIVAALACLLACGRASIDTKEAVRQGVIDYLATRQNLNVSSMNLEVTSVIFKENEADAVVAFAPKGSGGAPVSIPYTLERKGTRWVVKPHAAGQNPHGGMGAPGTLPVPMPPMGESPHGAMPPAGGEMPKGGDLPPGHPKVPPK